MSYHRQYQQHPQHVSRGQSFAATAMPPPNIIPNLTPNLSPQSHNSIYSQTQPSPYDMPIAPPMSFSSSTDSNSSTRTASSMSSMGSGQMHYMSQPQSAYPDPHYRSQRQRSPSYASQGYGVAPEQTTMSPSISTREESMQRTGSRYICMMEGCESNFSRSADLNRHYTTVHFPDPSRLDCPKPRCSRKGEQGFTRQDHLTEHLRQYHGDQLPKRTPSKSKSTSTSTSQRTAKYVR